MVFGNLKALSVNFRFALVIVSALFLAACDSPEQRAQNHYDQGIELFEKGDLVKAKLEFRNALQFNKKLAPAWFALAKIDEKKRKWPQVAKSLINVVLLEPKHVQASLKLGNLYLLGGDTTNALKYSDITFGLEPENAQVLALRSAVLFKLNDDKRAEEFALKALKIDPKNVGAYIVLASGQMKTGNTAKGLEYIEQGLAKNERDIGLYLIKIRALEILKNIKEIETTFQKLIELYPQAISFQQALVRFYIQRGDKGKAEQVIRNIAAKKPDDFLAGINVVRFVNSVNGADAAQVELEKLITTGANTFKYQLALAQLHVSQSKPDKALSLLRKLVKQESSTENELPAKIQLSRMLLITKNTKEAEDLIENILSKDEKNISALLMRANRNIAKTKLDAAITDLREVLNEQPRSISALLMLSKAHELGGSIELADERLAVAVKASKYTPNIGLQYVRFLSSRGFSERAEDVTQQILSRNPRNIPTLTRMAQFKLRQQDWIGAEEISERIRKLDSESRASSQILGAALGGQKKYNASIEVLRAAYDKTPDTAQSMASLIQAYARGNKLKEAEEFLNGVLKANPKNADALILLGRLQIGTKRLKEGEASFKTALAAEPASVSGYRALSGLYLGQRKITEAKELLKQGLEKTPERENFVLRLVLATVLEQTGKKEEAILEYEILVKQQPGSAVVSNNLASLYTELRSDEKSLDRALLLTRQFRNSKIPHFKDTLGWVYYKKSEYRNAISLLQDASLGLPKNPEVRYHLGLSYLDNKQHKEAVVELEKALELSKGATFSKRKETVKALERAKNAS